MSTTRRIKGNGQISDLSFEHSKAVARSPAIGPLEVSSSEERADPLGLFLLRLSPTRRPVYDIAPPEHLRVAAVRVLGELLS